MRSGILFQSRSVGKDISFIILGNSLTKRNSCRSMILCLLENCQVYTDRQDTKLVRQIYMDLTNLIHFIIVNLSLCYFRNTLIYAIRCGSKDIATLLLQKGIDFFCKDVFGWTALRYAIEGHCTL